MRIVELDATDWRSVLDFYSALKVAPGACSGHGDSPDTWIDSMIYGGMNAVEAPYTVRIIGTAACSNDLQQEIVLLADVIREAGGDDVNVKFQIEP